MESEFSTTDTHYRRKKYIINPKFQYFMLGFSVLQCLITIGALWGLNIHFFHEFKTMGEQAHIPENHVYFQFLTEQQAYFTQAILIVLAVISGFLITTITILSHRVAGPLYRLTKHMKDIAEGKPLGNVTFRNRDFFPELALTFNRMVQKIKDDPSNSDSSTESDEAA